MTPIELIQQERGRQGGIWGRQRLSWAEWLLVLTEEVGEACADANALTWHDGTTFEGKMQARFRLRHELVQVAAVAVQIIEHLTEETDVLSGVKPPQDVEVPA